MKLGACQNPLYTCNGRSSFDGRPCCVRAFDMPPSQTIAAPAFRKTAETFATGAKTLAQQYFVSPKVFAEEQDRIFSKQWVLVGHQSQLAEAGDYFVAALAGESLIVVRDQRSVIRGFYN